MGAFILYNIHTGIDCTKEEANFKQLGFIKKKSFTLGSYQLELYKKQQLSIDNFAETGEYSIYACGSLVYKGLSYSESLKTLLNDYTKSKIDLKLLYGNYTIFFYDKKKGKISFLIDPSFIKNCYIDFKSKIISSHFLAIVQLSSTNYSLNKLAVIESLITGNLIPPSTYANEIQRCCAVNYNQINLHFKDIYCISNTYIIENQISSFESAVADANNRLEQYFDAQVNLTNEFGAHLGLTGGFDSRLLLLHSQSKLKNLTINSFYRENSIEFNIAKELANEARLTFKSFEQSAHLNLFKPVDSELAFLFMDGQIRSENYIDEEFNLPAYSELLYQGTGIGYHGCGGEQYRNADRFSGKQGFIDWVKNEWVLKLGSNIVSSRQLKTELIESISDKIRMILSYDKSYIDLFTLKRIQNEIWNQSNRATRVNALNQQIFYFAPFTEYQLSKPAYNYIPFLGSYAEFQLAMMRSFNSKLNDLKLTYGFSITEGPSFISRIESSVAHALPRNWLIMMHRKLKSINKITTEDWINNEQTAKITEGINVEAILNSNYYGKNLLALQKLSKRLTQLFII